jgi:hypothetical protein
LLYLAKVKTGLAINGDSNEFYSPLLMEGFAGVENGFVLNGRNG